MLTEWWKNIGREVFYKEETKELLRIALDMIPLNDSTKDFHEHCKRHLENDRD